MLAFNLSDIITVPFGYLMSWLYDLTSNYGVALILFAVIVKLVLFPISAKSKKSTMKMSRLTPRVQELQAKYANDPQKQNEAIQALYKEENASMTGGCLWSLIPLLILLPLYAVIRQPITYMLHASTDVANQIMDTMKTAAPELFTGNSYYHQIIAAQHIPEYAQALRDAIPGISESILAGINFNFLGIDLGTIPQLNIFGWGVYDWAHIGLFLCPLLSAGSQVLSMVIMTKMNNSVVTDKDGLKDEETAKNSQMNQTNKTMMVVGPLMSLWIGFTIPAGLSIYWFVQGLVSIVQDVYLTNRYRKIYDAEDAVRLQKKLEREKEEAEKERQRAERRAANPDGITENTSKKKLAQKQQKEADAAKAAAAKEYAARKGLPTEPEAEEKLPLSGMKDRPNCKGRAYDPGRYRNTEE